MMMSFCKNLSVHSFLSFTKCKDNETVVSFSTHPHHHHHNFTTATTAAASGGLGLFTVSNNLPKPANVVGCAAIKSPSPTSSSSSSSSSSSTTTTATTTSTAAKKDPGGIGFIDDVGGSVDGLMSCTESLGFESSDERIVDDHHIENSIDHDNKGPGLFSSGETSSTSTSIWRRKHVKREVKNFPPPLSSLDHDGRPTIYLHPVRKDGRLELTGIKIDRRPEILRASRENGRLRLHLIRDQEDQAEEEMQDIQEKSGPEMVVEEKAVDQEEAKEEEEEEEEEEERVDKWQFPVASGGGGDGFRRCNEQLVTPHHHHRDLNAWRQQYCLTIT